MKIIKRLLILLGFSLGATEKPNVILIFADDLGIEMLGAYGQKVINTPNIDRLAEEGMKFNNYYGAVFCAPARWTLLSGLHDGRLGGWSHNRAGLPIKYDMNQMSLAEYEMAFAEHKKTSLKIDDSEVFLAQMAAKAGYYTGQIGKLDRGFLTWDERVKRHGWDYHYGYYDHVRAHGFYPPYLWENGKKILIEGNDSPTCGKTSDASDEPVGWGGTVYSQDLFLDKILSFIRKNKSRPFFLYHPTQLPHGPIAVNEIDPLFKDRADLNFVEKKYATMIKILDDHVGEIVKELKKQGIDDKTVIFFTSDNGHELYYDPTRSFNKQLLANGEKADLDNNKWRSSDFGDVFNAVGTRAGLKRSVYQGGVQVPMIVRWPGNIAQGTETKHLSAHYDFMATLAEICGAEVPKGKDSLSYLPTLKSEKQLVEHDYVIIGKNQRQMGKSALISKTGYKLIEVDRKRDLFQLYDLRSDNDERHNIIAQFPELAEKLKKQLLSQLESTRPDLN
ncbi:arylsulfatase A precursor [Lentisphaera araneosa HTCC2155]|uniref:Arylsulfatase A n=1 Tax=Lentisphaera araneosa HTCC2155 TaxID=313628 RepID=A6DQD5_9BACT|nr:arylsulfatase [Lentisphaera araneosa]EDM26186.1 arylsulfatase A precursor [Lentisphaera araneosa HTCC2155]